MRSSEEEAELVRSVKKFKDSSTAQATASHHKQVSYRDSLVGDIPGAYAQAFSFDRIVEDDVDSNSDLDDIVEGKVDVHLSKETKARMRAPWAKALIVKVFALREIGKAIGPVLRIDSYTATGTRTSYARLCIQINLMKPLVTAVRVGKLRQKVLYEGISALCFCCGRMGHKQEACSYRVSSPEQTGDAEQSEPLCDAQKATQTEPNFGEWMLVKRKKRTAQFGRGRGTKISHPQQEVSSKVTKDITNPFDNSLTNFKPDVTFKFNAGQTKGDVGTDFNTSESREISCHTQHIKDTTAIINGEASLRSSVDVIKSQPQKVGSLRGKPIISPRERRNPISSSSRALKRPNPYFVRNQIQHADHGAWQPLLPFSDHYRVGNMVSQQSHSHPRCGDCSNPGSPDGSFGQVRGGIGKSLEAHVSDHTN
ncbi:hypothetical protein CFP56_022161 [Quercus suber]|uniref:CCHC-type domain-containing protein n=1 Tax=Quercus suber TaxID=58331 RepID=A0AAW0KDY2_QUESU